MNMNAIQIKCIRRDAFGWTLRQLPILMINVNILETYTYFPPISIVHRGSETHHYVAKIFLFYLCIAVSCMLG